MKKHPEYITIIQRKGNKNNGSNLELRVCDCKKELEQLNKNTEEDRRLFYEKIKTDKTGANIISGFINYLKNNGMSRYMTNSLQISDDKKNAFVYSPENREEYNEMGRSIVDYLESIRKD